jgi:hypothetical protein
MRRYRALILVVLPILGALFVFLYFGILIHAEYQHQSWSRKILARYDYLRVHPPEGIDPGVWYEAIVRTINLHANCASTSRYITDGNLAMEFATGLAIRLEKGPSRELIAWIWRQYPLFTRDGLAYAMKYEPTL